MLIIGRWEKVSIKRYVMPNWKILKYFHKCLEIISLKERVYVFF